MLYAGLARLRPQAGRTTNNLFAGTMMKRLNHRSWGDDRAPVVCWSFLLFRHRRLAEDKRGLVCS
jgi:hypothetical protein